LSRSLGEKNTNMSSHDMDSGGSEAFRELSHPVLDLTLVDRQERLLTELREDVSAVVRSHLVDRRLSPNLLG
jgi:hypothetical protein